MATYVTKERKRERQIGEKYGYTLFFFKWDGQIMSIFCLKYVSMFCLMIIILPRAQKYITLTFLLPDFLQLFSDIDVY